MREFLFGNVEMAELNLAPLWEVASDLEDVDPSENSAWKSKALAHIYGRNDQAAIHVHFLLQACKPTADNFRTLTPPLLVNGEQGRTAVAAGRRVESSEGCSAGQQVLPAVNLTADLTEEARQERRRVHEFYLGDLRTTTLLSLASAQGSPVLAIQQSSWLVDICRPNEDSFLGPVLSLGTKARCDQPAYDRLCNSNSHDALGREDAHRAVVEQHSRVATGLMCKSWGGTAMSLTSLPPRPTYGFYERDSGDLLFLGAVGTAEMFVELGYSSHE